MNLDLYYSYDNITRKFDSSLKLQEYYISRDESELKIFIKGYNLHITDEEYAKLSKVDFRIQTINGVVLFTKSEVRLESNRISF